MDKLIEYLVEGLKSFKNKHYFLALLIIIGVFLFGFSFYLRSNSEYASVMLSGSFSIFALSFLLFILILTSEGKEIKKNIDAKMDNIVDLLLKLQNLFSFDKCELNNDLKSRKNLFKIKNDLYIVASIDEENFNIDNFYIRSSNTEERKIIKNSGKKEIGKEEKNNLGYKYTHIAYSETIKLCQDGKYKEAIDFLINILKEAKVIK